MTSRISANTAAISSVRRSAATVAAADVAAVADEGRLFVSVVIEKGDEISGFLQKQPGVDFTYTTVGIGRGGGATNGQIFVKLVEKHDRLPQGEIENQLRTKLREDLGSHLQGAFAVPALFQHLEHRRDLAMFLR